MTPEDRAAIEARHYSVFDAASEWDEPHCRNCDDGPWPCDAAVLLAALREAEAELAAALEVEEGLRQLIERENAEREDLEAREARLREALRRAARIVHASNIDNPTHVTGGWETCPAGVCRSFGAALASTEPAPTEPEAERP